MAVIVAATPAVVCCIANREKDTPKKGPNKAPKGYSF
jgi:hypothetical protein